MKLDFGAFPGSPSPVSVRSEGDHPHPVQGDIHQLAWPKLLADSDLGIDRLRDAVAFRSARFVPCGDDVIFDAEPERTQVELRKSA